MTDLTSNNTYTVATGTSTTGPFITHFITRDPTPQDVNYPIQKRWINTTFDREWILEGFASGNGVVTAVWSQVSSGTLGLESLTGNSGGIVNPDSSHNINVLGDTTTIEVAGNPATHTLTISTAGTVATSYVEDSGTAVPLAGVLNINGTSAQGIVTSGSGNTVSITADNASSAQKGVAKFNSTEFTVTAGAVASNPITVTSSGGTIAITGSPVNLGGTINLETASGQAFSSIKNQVITITGTYTPTVGMKYCSIQILGGGGGGGSADTTDGSHVAVGESGGAGEYAVGIFSAATIGASQSVTIGAGGSAGVASAGGAGGTTSVGILITAVGGSGGNEGSAEVAGAGPGGLGGAGGSGGDYRTPGQAASPSFGIASPLVTVGGDGGSSQLGAGGNANITTGVGNVGLGFGSGGSGGLNILSQASSRNGGAGSAGVVIITEYIT